MALGLLKIIFIVLIIVAAVGQLLLYRNSGKLISNNTVFICNTILGIIVSFLVYASLPSNYTGQRIVAIAWGIIALIAFILKSKGKETLVVSKIMLTVSVVGGMIHLLI